MSREERRQYARMTRGMDRTPALPPGARARAERVAARRAARQASGEGRIFSTRFWVVAVLVALIVGYLAFSFQWPAGHAWWVGILVGLVTLAAQIGTRLLQKRALRQR